MKHNRMAMKTMQQMLKQGGQIIWVAPSGGRDRTDAEGNYCVSPFDAKSVEMFRLMSDKAGRRTHFYPTSMLTHNIAPPPEQARVLPPLTPRVPEPRSVGPTSFAPTQAAPSAAAACSDEEEQDDEEQDDEEEGRAPMLED